MTTSQTPHRALLVLTAAPADDAHGGDPWPVFTTEGWTVDVTCIGGPSPGPRIPATPTRTQPPRTQRPEQPGVPGRPGLEDADDDSPPLDSADLGLADRDCADYDIICFVDGPTTTWVSPRSSDLSRLMSRISEYGDIVAAVRPAAFNRLEEFSVRDC